MRFIILSALLTVASIVCVTAQSSGTVGYNRTTLNTAPTNLNYRADTVTSKITNASIYGITGILKGDGIGGSVLATPGVDYEPAGGGGGTTVSVNGTAVSTPNFTNSATATFSVATTNVSVNPTNLANAQIAAGAAIDFSKLSGVAALVHTHAGEDITSGTVAAARIDSAIATDAEVAAGYQPLDTDLTTIAAFGSTGIPARTGAGTWSLRTVTAGAGVGVSNGDGVSGNPTLSWAPETQVNSFTLFDGTQASRTETISLSGPTDPVLTFANNSVSLNVPLSVGVVPTTGAYINLGTNAPNGYLLKSPSQSGITTNLGFNWTHNSTLFDTNKAPDEVSMWGYNISPGGGRESSADTAIGFSIEGNYNLGGAEYAEAHLLYVDKTNVQHRPISFQVNKNNHETAIFDFWTSLVRFNSSFESGNPPYFSAAPGAMTWLAESIAFSPGLRFTSSESNNVQIIKQGPTTVDLIVSGFRNHQFGSGASAVTLTTNGQSLFPGGARMQLGSALTVEDASSVEKLRLRSSSGGLILASDVKIWFSSTTSSGGAVDIGLAREGVGFLRVANGSTSSGDLKVKLIATPSAAPTVASAATIAPTAPITFISGTTTIDTITAPSPISSTGGQITLIPTGVWATSTSGNVALATTAVVSKALIMTYDQGTTKWYPSY